MIIISHIGYFFYLVSPLRTLVRTLRAYILPQMFKKNLFHHSIFRVHWSVVMKFCTMIGTVSCFITQTSD